MLQTSEKVSLTKNSKRKKKMKTKMNFPVRTLSGTVDDTVFGSYNHGGYCQTRKYVVPTYTANNQHVGAIGKNLKNVYKAASAEYIADLKQYCVRNKKQNVPWTQKAPASLMVFIALMYAWYKTDPTHIDLTAVTIADIVTKDADVRTIKRAIDAGYIRSIKSYADLTSDIQ